MKTGKKKLPWIFTNCRAPWRYLFENQLLGPNCAEFSLIWATLTRQCAVKLETVTKQRKKKSDSWKHDQWRKTKRWQNISATLFTTILPSICGTFKISHPDQPWLDSDWCLGRLKEHLIPVSNLWAIRNIHPSSIHAYFPGVQDHGCLMEPIPAVIGRRQGDTLDEVPVYRRAT